MEFCILFKEYNGSRLGGLWNKGQGGTTISKTKNNLGGDLRGTMLVVERGGIWQLGFIDKVENK